MDTLVFKRSQVLVKQSLIFLPAAFMVFAYSYIATVTKNNFALLQIIVGALIVCISVFFAIIGTSRNNDNFIMGHSIARMGAIINLILITLNQLIPQMNLVNADSSVEIKAVYILTILLWISALIIDEIFTKKICKKHMQI